MSLSTFKSTTTYHLLSYGTLLGSTLFQSFISGVIAFRVLPRPQFSTLQKHTFPIYFTLQTATSAALLVTHPSGARNLLSRLPLVSSFVSSPASTHPLARSNDSLAASLIALMFVTGLVNWVYVGPQTTEVMRLRKHQETRDGKKSYDQGPQSVEMQALNRRFGVLHGLSSLVNLVGLGSMVWYAGVLAEGMKL